MSETVTIVLDPAKNVVQGLCQAADGWTSSYAPSKIQALKVKASILSSIELENLITESDA